MKKTRHSVTQKSRKVGRPRALVESEQVQVRLPVLMVDELRKAGVGRGRSLSEEIRERLASSLLPPRTDEESALVGRQVEQFAREITEAFGVAWHKDRQAHAAFVEMIKRLLADLPQPSAEVSKLSASPAQAAELLYNRHMAIRRQWNERKSAEMRTPAKKLLGDGT